MEKTCVAGPQASHQIVHREFKCLRFGYCQYPVAVALRAFGPTGAIEGWIEVVFEYGAFRLIENTGALIRI
jgi:hypothetical protein